MGNALVHNDGLSTVESTGVESLSYADNSEYAPRNQQQEYDNRRQEHKQRIKSQYAGDYSVSCSENRGYYDKYYSRNEQRDIREEEEEDYRSSDLDAYRNDPGGYINERLIEYEQTRKGYHSVHRSTYKATQGEERRQTYEEIMQIDHRRIDDDDGATFEKETVNEGTVKRAESDMACADSQDASESPDYKDVCEDNDDEQGNQKLPSSASSVLGSLARLEQEQKALQQQLEDVQSVHSDSFSTLNTIDLMHRYATQNGISKEELEKRMRNSDGLPTELADNPASFKLEDLLRQQQLQEEKLQRQLDHLRRQKQRLQQLQLEKNTPLSITMDFPSDRKSGRDIVSPDHETAGYLDRTNKIHQEVPRTKSDDEPEVIHVEPEIIHLEDDAESEIVVVDDSDPPECKMEVSKTQPSDDEETLTGECVSFPPEFDDVPTHCTVVDPESTYYQDTDTTLSVTGTSPDEENDNYNGIDAALTAVFSSMDDDIDLDFVAKYDNAFNAFLAAFHQKFDPKSDMVQNLKVAKLQKILEASYEVEAQLETHLEDSAHAKTKMDSVFQQKLKEASRYKATRTIELQNEIKKLKRENKSLEGKLRWDMLMMAIKRARNLRELEESLEKRSREVSSREELLKLLPDQTATYSVKKAASAEPLKEFSPQHEKEMQRLQIDNALLQAEVKLLQNRIAQQKELAKKQTWVDTILLHLDDKKKEKLRNRYTKKLGVSF